MCRASGATGKNEERGEAITVPQQEMQEVLTVYAIGPTVEITTPRRQENK
jgi:hypothetical protein